MLRLRIRELAEAQGINQSQLQLKAQVTSGVIRRYWSNQTVDVRLKLLDQIARALGVKSIDLLEETEETEEKQTA